MSDEAEKTRLDEARTAPAGISDDHQVLCFALAGRAIAARQVPGF